MTPHCLSEGTTGRAVVSSFRAAVFALSAAVFTLSAAAVGGTMRSTIDLLVQAFPKVTTEEAGEQFQVHIRLELVTKVHHLRAPRFEPHIRADRDKQPTYGDGQAKARHRRKQFLQFMFHHLAAARAAKECARPAAKKGNNDALN